MKIQKNKKRLFIVLSTVIAVISAGFVAAKINNSFETFAAGSYPKYNMSSWVFFDPVNPDSTCNETNYWTLYSSDTTCYRWFLAELNDNTSKSTVRLILDHNVVNTNFSGIEAALANIETVWSNYDGEIGILTEDDIYSLLKLNTRPTLDNISVKGIEVNFNYTTNTIYDIAGQRYDNHGFWSSTLYPDDNGYAYTITEFGNNRLAEVYKDRGVRPVIEIEKDKLTNAPAAKDLTNTLNNSTPLKYKSVSSHGYTYRQLQGFTLSNNNLAFYSSNAGNPDNGLVFGYGGNNFTSAVSGTPYYAEGGGHGNDMTFNPNTNKIILVAANDLWVLNGDTLAHESNIDTADASKMGFTFGQIGYDGVDNKYVAGSKKTAYLTNDSFEGVQYSIDMPHNEYTQGLEYRNGYIYQTGWKTNDCASLQLYCDNLANGSGIINVYNAKFDSEGVPSKDFGRRVKEIYINGTANMGELESISFRDDEVFLGFTNYRPSNACVNTDAGGNELCYVFYHFPYSNMSIDLRTDVTYVDTPDSTTITVSSNDPLELATGFTRVSGEYSMSKTVYSESISEVVQVCDRYSNCSNVNISHINTSYRQNQSVVFSSDSVNKIYGDASFTNVATTNGDGVISYASDNTAVAEVNPATGEVTIIGAGTANIIATASQTEAYYEGTASYALSVAKATSSKPSEIEDVIVGTIGTPLSSISFSTDGIYWVDGDAIIMSGENEYQVYYTQNNDTNNYITETFTVTVKGVIHVYLVLEGDQQVYTKGESEVASFRINADLSLFEEFGSIYIDEQPLSSDFYRAEYGSTIISLKKAYMDSLAIGQHLFTIKFGDFGIATAKFTVANAPYVPDTPDTPNTPDAPVAPDVPEQSDEPDIVVPNTNYNKASGSTQSKTSQDGVAVPDTGISSEDSNDFTLDMVHVLLLCSSVAPAVFYVFHKKSIRHRKF